MSERITLTDRLVASKRIVPTSGRIEIRDSECRGLRLTKTSIAHVIPLPSLALSILDEMPTFVGRYLFSANGGKSAFQGFHRAKQVLDEVVGFSDWTLHDCRRSARTYWSAIPDVPEVAKELMLGHVQGGIVGTYDRFSYLDQKRKLLTLWQDLVMDMVNPPEAIKLAAD